jgi:hypothetical protein
MNKPNHPIYIRVDVLKTERTKTDQKYEYEDPLPKALIPNTTHPQTASLKPTITTPPAPTKPPN